MEPIVDYICSQLKELTAIPSPSGFTKQAAAYVCATLEGMGSGPQLPRKGNTLVELGGQESPLVLAVRVDALGVAIPLGLATAVRRQPRVRAGRGRVGDCQSGTLSKGAPVFSTPGGFHANSKDHACRYRRGGRHL